MRIGIAAARTPTWPKNDWLEQSARRLGHDVVREKNDGVLKLLPTCDVVILGQRNTFGHPAHFREAFAKPHRAVIVYWWFDLMYTSPRLPLEKQPIFESFGETMRLADLTLVKERDCIAEYRRLGINAHYLDQGCPVDMPEGVTREPATWDMLVWGQSGKYPERLNGALDVARAGFKVAWADRVTTQKEFDRQPWTPAFELPALASRARTVLSCGRVNSIPGYWSDQFWMALGMGACVLRKWTEGLPEGPYLTWRTNEELLSHVEWAKLNPEKAAEMGRAAREWTMANHTLDHRMRDLLVLVESYRVKGKV